MDDWKRIKPDISTRGGFLGRQLVVSKDKLKALNWQDKVRLLYDAATPRAVCEALRHDEFAMVAQAYLCREGVLSGRLKNPMEAPVK